MRSAHTAAVRCYGLIGEFSASIHSLFYKSIPDKICQDHTQRSSYWGHSIHAVQFYHDQTALQQSFDAGRLY